MLLPATETLIDGDAIDTMAPFTALGVMVDVQLAALEAVRRASPAIAEGAEVLASAIRAGHSITYAAAGSSGLMALADACELPGTFGLSPDLVHVHMAGGVPVDGRMPGDTEDDRAAAEAVVQNLGQGDVAIVLSASGTTPYAVQVARSAKARGVRVIGLANNPGTDLLSVSDVAICLETPPEAIAGSTRMGAGTAQKAALNLMSSLMGIRLGHVYQGMMVNVVADNTKLIQRAARMVERIASVSEATAQTALATTKGDVKLAALVAAGTKPDAARALLAAHDGHLAACFHDLKSNSKSNS